MHVSKSINFPNFGNTLFQLWYHIPIHLNPWLMLTIYIIPGLEPLINLNIPQAQKLESCFEI